MPVEKSAGAIIFRNEVSGPVFLLLQYPSNSRAKRSYWDLPKGHLEKGEKELDAARREITEETGLKGVRIVEGFKEVIKYFFKADEKNIMKFVTFFLAETKIKEITISFEHMDYAWLPYKEAFEKLSFKNAKNILKKANDFIKKNK